MDAINLKGTYYEIGFKYGQRLKKSKFKLPKFSQKKKNFALDCRFHVNCFFPEFLEELKGVADAANLNFDDLVVHSLIIPTIPYCTIFAIKRNNTIWFGRNYDMYYSFKKSIETTLCEPLNQYRSIGHSDIFVGRDDGINEKGLAVAQAGICDYHKPGLSFWIIIRYILDKCSSIKESIDFLLDIPHYSTMHYLLADKKRNMALIEIGPDDNIAIRRPKKDFLISTNHYNDPSMKKIKIHIPPDSHIRYNRVYKALLNAPEIIDENYFKDLLSDHKGLVCSHRDNINLGTLWSAIYNLKTIQIWRAIGHPCLNPYFEDKRLKSIL